jgi:hypothetical protein
MLIDGTGDFATIDANRFFSSGCLDESRGP